MVIEKLPKYFLPIGLAVTIHHIIKGLKFIFGF